MIDQGKIKKDSSVLKESSIKLNKKIENKVEKYGYTLANKLHKFGVLSLFFFITFNIGLFFKEYNSYWRSRRV